MITELKLDFEVLTPLFLGSANQQGELRPPALKGLLRFWYRAVDPNFSQAWENTRITREARFFGGTAQGAGQSPFSLRIVSAESAYLSWQDLRAARFNEGRGRETRNGLVYLGFPFQMRGNENRTAIASGHIFTVHCIIPKNNLGADFQHALLASWWLLGHLGSAGSRSRRGFGSLMLQNWSLNGGDWPESKDLPLLCQIADDKSWRAGLNQAQATFQRWFGNFPNAAAEKHHHPHLGGDFRSLLLLRSFPRRQWAEALAYMGGLLQEFRVRRAPDSQDVKDHLLALSRQGGKPLQHAPSRTSFGLPLTFRYASVPRETITFVPHDQERQTTFERHGSLLHLRLVAIRDNLYPLFLRLDGDVPGQQPPAAIRSAATRLRDFKENAMDLFLDSLRGK